MDPLPPRRRWSVDDVTRMVRAGVLVEEDRVELIEGELYQMAPKGNRHEMMQRRLSRFLLRHAPDDIAVSVEPSLYLTADSAPEPDLVLFPDHLRIKEVRGRDVLLAIEVADATLSFDLRVKAPLYAHAGVRELWVINVRADVSYVFTQPSPEGYRAMRQAAFDDPLVAPLEPPLPVRLADLLAAPFASERPS